MVTGSGRLMVFRTLRSKNVTAGWSPQGEQAFASALRSNSKLGFAAGIPLFNSHA